MGDRHFTDRDGMRWEIRVRGRQEWSFDPLDDNPGPTRTAKPPGYETDPFELSIEELQKLLEAAPKPKPGARKSPFLD